MSTAIQPATFTSNLPQFERDHAKAIDAALRAAAEKYKAAVQARLLSGYKSGTFKTGKVAGSIIITAPKTEKGKRVIRVGTKNFIARLWEFGHQNRYSRRFERVPVWRPIAIAQGQALAGEVLKSYRAMMQNWKPTGTGAARTRRKR